MKDSRLTIWTNPTTHATGTTSNTGPTFDLFDGSAPNAISEPTGTSIKGLGVEILQTTASGTAQVTSWEYEISKDGSTWVNGGYIGSNAMAAASTTYKLRGTISAGSDYRYARLVASNTGTGTSTSKVFVEDYQGMFATGGSN